MLKNTTSSSHPGNQSRLNVMNFLNEIAETYPQAISFASGRPSERFFDFHNSADHIDCFAQYFARTNSLDIASAYNRLAQYGRTNGIINDLISAQVRNDEGIKCRADQIIVTVGCQEALDLCLTTLCNGTNDVVLVRSPTYIGITGVADLKQIAMRSFECEAPEQFAEVLVDSIAQAKSQGQCPRVLYLVPDFDNPTGVSLSRETREAVIEICARNKIIILEDNPYGFFRFENSRIPTMHALDKHGCVIYLGTYSKTICPALRVGFAILPDCMFGEPRLSDELMQKLSRAKSFVSVNTSQITQAIVGGVLLSENLSLARIIQQTTAFYRANRDAAVAALARAFKEFEGKIKWNNPAGGFFLTVSLPFDFARKEAEVCARDFGVLVMPMTFFSLNDSNKTSVRIAFSNSTPEIIDEGVKRFRDFVARCLSSNLD